jgi:hypothetical protein
MRAHEKLFGSIAVEGAGRYYSRGYIDVQEVIYADKFPDMFKALPVQVFPRMKIIACWAHITKKTCWARGTSSPQNMYLAVQLIPTSFRKAMVQPSKYVISSTSLA